MIHSAPWGGSTPTEMGPRGEVIETLRSAPGRGGDPAWPRCAVHARGYPQVPPQFSAVKRSRAARALTLRREGEVMSWPRGICMSRNAGTWWPMARMRSCADLHFVCGSGGYVAVVSARDLGAGAGCPSGAACCGCAGHGVGPFDIEESVERWTGSRRWRKRPPRSTRWLRARGRLGCRTCPILRATGGGGRAAEERQHLGQVFCPARWEYRTTWLGLAAGVPWRWGRYRAGELHPERVFQTVGARRCGRHFKSRRAAAKAGMNHPGTIKGRRGLGRRSKFRTARPPSTRSRGSGNEGGRRAPQSC